MLSDIAPGIWFDDGCHLFKKYQSHSHLHCCLYIPLDLLHIHIHMVWPNIHTISFSRLLILLHSLSFRYTYSALTKELIFLDWEVVACWTCLCLTPEGTRQNIGRVRCISYNLASSAQTVLGVDCAHWGQVTANTSASCTHHPGEKDFKNI